MLTGSTLEIQSATGPRLLESALFEALAERCAEAASDPSLLAAPLRVVVPSRALRSHLAAGLVSKVGGAALGVQIQTLESAARELLDRSGEAPLDPLLTGVAVRAHARRQPALHRTLDPLEDGYAAVVATVDDLLDAGFRPEWEDPLLEALADAESGAAYERGAALFGVAKAIAREVEAGRVGHRSARLSRAADLLREGARLELPTRALWIYGFADATGVQLDFLEALTGAFPSTVWLDWPEGRIWKFGEGLRMRLASAARPPAASPSAQIAVEKWQYPDHEGEAQAAARWALAQLESGIPAERVAIVARDLPRHRLALCRQLERHAVPFSSDDERGGAGPLARRLEASFALIERSGALSVERWLDARADLGASARADLRDACLLLGAETLADLAALADEVAQATLLSAPAGIEVNAEDVPRVRNRSVSAADLKHLRERARSTLETLEAWPAESSLEGRVDALSGLATELGWASDGPEREAIDAAFAEIERAGAWPIPRVDWPRVLRRALDSVGWGSLGGRGGGVQLLGVVAARGRTFDALRIVGLERGVFPRGIAEDPLLPDALRRKLRSVLSDLPIKSEGHEEERFLFAQLLAAAPEVIVSRARHDARGRPTHSSPLFESLEGVLRDGPAAQLPLLSDVAALGAALTQARDAAGLDPAEGSAPAKARLATIAEFDARSTLLGPYLGVVGPILSELDPRSGLVSVTLLENTARCSWSAFLERFLGLKPATDARAPLPKGSDALLLGNVVHEILEVLCDPENADSSWPDAVPTARLEQMAADYIGTQGGVMPGYSLVLARRAAPFVEAARRLDLADPWKIVAVEQEATGSGVASRIRFRADRLDERDGEQRFTDWKTGKRNPESLTQEGQEKGVLKLLSEGTLLQSHVYASTGARGRYVYLAPEADYDGAERVVEATAEGAQQQAFEEALVKLFAALDRGALLPRLSAPGEDSEPRACQNCDVRQACLRGDSGARARLVAWANGEGERDELDAAGHALWKMGSSR